MDGDKSNKGLNSEQFIVQGMTGVDLTLTIAGPGSRSYAFIIDWHIRLLLAIAWLVLGVFIGAGGFMLLTSAKPWVVMIAVLPAIFIYLFYHPVLELLMRGQTPGKRMAGVRVVNRDGGAPSSGAILIRNAFRLIDSLPVFYAIGLGATFLTEQRVRIGDMAAGTLLIIDEHATSKAARKTLSADAFSTTSIDPNTLDLIQQLLERWKSLDKARRKTIAISLLQRLEPQTSQSFNDLSDAELHARLSVLAGDAGRR